MQLGIGLLLVGATLSNPCPAQDLEVMAEVWRSDTAGAVANVPEADECPFLRAGEKAHDGEVCPADGHLASRPSFGCCPN